MIQELGVWYTHDPVQAGTTAGVEHFSYVRSVVQAGEVVRETFDVWVSGERIHALALVNHWNMPESYPKISNRLYSYYLL